jgi:hypothetical protein
MAAVLANGSGQSQTRTRASNRVRYSGWWFGADRQRQRTVKRLVISRWSVFTARLQIRATNDTAVIYSSRPVRSPTCPPESPSDAPRRPRATSSFKVTNSCSR